MRLQSDIMHSKTNVPWQDNEVVIRVASSILGVFKNVACTHPIKQGLFAWFDLGAPRFAWWRSFLDFAAKHIRILFPGAAPLTGIGYSNHGSFPKKNSLSQEAVL